LLKPKDSSGPETAALIVKHTSEKISKAKDFITTILKAEYGMFSS